MASHPSTPQPRHILSADQFDPDFITALFARAKAIQTETGPKLRTGRPNHTLSGHVMYRLFFKASTRTYESFGFAAAHLGMSVLGTQDIQATSVAKGESLEDTIRTINCYDPSVIVMRAAGVGDANRAAAVSDAPIINGGDGSGEHPTQALLDLYTIQQELGRLENLHIVMGMDLHHSRTIRSLALLASKFRHNRFTFVAAPHFELQPDIKSLLDKSGAHYEETSDLASSLKTADIVYWNRFQVERHTEEQKAYLAAHPETFEQYALGAKEIGPLPQTARILDPLPRVREIKTELDSDPRAAYFRQMRYGMFVRMALLEWVLKDKVR